RARHHPGPAMVGPGPRPPAAPADRVADGARPRHRRLDRGSQAVGGGRKRRREAWTPDDLRRMIEERRKLAGWARLRGASARGFALEALVCGPPVVSAAAPGHVILTAMPTRSTHDSHEPLAVERQRLVEAEAEYRRARSEDYVARVIRDAAIVDAHRAGMSS